MSTLGDAVQSIEFSELERKRLSTALLSPESLPARLLKGAVSAIHDHRFWASQQRTFGVNGFRPGNPSARAHVVRRALEALKRSSEPQNAPIWILYRHSAQHYVIDELSALNRLLAREAYSTPPARSQDLTEHIFRSIKRALALYDVPVSQVKELYELWGFDRFDGMDQLLEDQSIDAQTVSRLITHASSELKQKLTQELDSLRDKIGNITATQGKAAQASSALISSLRDELNAKLSILTERIEPALHTPAERLRTSVPPDNDANAAANHPMRRAEDSQLAALQSLKSDMQQRINDLTRRVARQEEKLAATLALMPKRATSTRVTTHPSSTLAQLASHTADLLREKGIASLTAAAAWTLISLVRASRLIVSDKEALPCSPLLCSQSTQIKVVGVSPTWLSQTDWAEPFEFVSGEDSHPRALVLLDFDVAIQEAYLLPSLLVWLSRLHENSHNRIVLVPSAEDLSQVSPRILESALVLMSDGSVMRELRHMERDDALAQQHATSAIPKDFLKCVPFVHNKHREDLTKIFRQSAIHLPTRLLESFLSTDNILQKHLPDGLSGRLASEATLLPWISRTRGDGLARVAQELIAMLFGKLP